MIDFMGQAGFVWWFGVVEDIDDPMKLGRVRVRVFGYHPSDLGTLKTADLPWAHPLQDITSASISGVGRSPTGLVAGSHVFGFFRDGLNAQQPVVMMSVGGLPREIANPQRGFNDPSGIYPVEANVPDTNRLATGDEIDKTIVDLKKFTRKKDVLVALDAYDDEKWDEPETPYKTKYPNNKVFATKSGMVEEWDDTPEKERHHTYHPSGSFEEVANGWEKDPAGTRVQKISGNNYEIVAGDDFIHISGDARITIDGSAKIYIGASKGGGNLNLQVDKDVNLYVKGSIKGIVEGDMSLNVSGDYRETIGGNKYTSVGGNAILESQARIVSKSLLDTVIKTDSSSEVFLSGTGRGIKLNSFGRSGSTDPNIPAEELP